MGKTIVLLQAGDITQQQANSLMKALQNRPDVVEQILQKVHG